MSNIVWEVATIPTRRRKSGEPFVSVGYGRMALNAEACELIDNIYQYEWAENLKGRIGDKIVQIGIRFTKEKKPTTVKLHRRKNSGKFVEGLDVNSISLVKSLFGDCGTAATKRYAIEKQDNQTLVIDLQNEVG